MCLLIKKPASVQFSDVELTDFFSHNPDGYGMMYSENGSLKLHRSIGDFSAFMRAYKRIEHKDLLIHFRQATHGDIAVRNAHPYPVIVRGNYQLWLMHNGILSHGNDKDKSRSDTYHFIKDVLAPLLDRDPAIAFEQKFLDAIGKVIGWGNKFAIADSLGNVGLVNEDSGVDFKGAWLSNTYAWSAYKLGGKGFNYMDDWTTRYDDYMMPDAEFGLDAADDATDAEVDDAIERATSQRVRSTRERYGYQVRPAPTLGKTWDFKMPSLLMRGI